MRGKLRRSLSAKKKRKSVHMRKENYDENMQASVHGNREIFKVTRSLKVAGQIVLDGFIRRAEIIS